MFATARASARRISGFTARASSHSAKPAAEQRFTQLAAATGFAVGASFILSSQQKEQKTQNSLMDRLTGGKSGEHVEEKFGKYWPRNIMILFGPPGAGEKWFPSSSLIEYNLARNYHLIQHFLLQERGRMDQKLKTCWGYHSCLQGTCSVRLLLRRQKSVSKHRLL